MRRWATCHSSVEIIDLFDSHRRRFSHTYLAIASLSSSGTSGQSIGQLVRPVLELDVQELGVTSVEIAAIYGEHIALVFRGYSEREPFVCIIDRNTSQVAVRCTTVGC